MNLRARRFAFLLSGAVALVACSSSSNPGTAGGSDTACGRYFNALQAIGKRCGESFELSAAGRFETVCANALSAPGSSPSLAASLDACATRIQTASCRGDSLDCETPSGTLPAGSACAENYQCQGYCKTTNSDSASVKCGICAAFTALGAACKSSSECGPKADCADGVCAAAKPLALGESCFEVAGDCGEGLRCGASGKCEAEAKIGEACRSTGDCVSDAECTAKVCTALSGEGGPCTFRCAAGLACGADSKCAKPVGVGIGAACDGTRPCTTGYCAGAGVSSTSDGNGNTTVTQKAGTCTAPIPDGQPCGGEIKGKCDAFAECIAGTCQLPNPASCK